MKNKKYLVVKIDAKTRERFKQHCREEGVTLAQGVEAVLRHAVRKIKMGVFVTNEETENSKT